MISSILLLLLMLAFFVLFFLFFVFIIFGSISAAPFVPSSNADLDAVFRFAKLKKNSKFVDLGSGDGRLVLRAVEQYGVMGTGVELNPFLVWYSRIWAYFKNQDRAKYICGSLYDYSLADCDVVYVFLLPRTMIKVVRKIQSECRVGTLIISRGFEAKGLKKIHQIEKGSFWTYFYRV